jgi:hypothetical protein
VLLFWDGESSVSIVEARGVPQQIGRKIEAVTGPLFDKCEANTRNNGQIALLLALNSEISWLFANQESVSILGTGPTK